MSIETAEQAATYITEVVAGIGILCVATLVLLLFIPLQTYMFYRRLPRVRVGKPTHSTKATVRKSHQKN